MLDQHPVVQWATYSVVEIHKDLDDVTTMLRDIQDDQADDTAASDTRFQTRADEHRDIAEGVNWLRGALNTCTGRETS